MRSNKNSLTELLATWDKLHVVGMTPEKTNSIMTETLMGDSIVKVAIEFQHRNSAVSGTHSISAYLVAYDFYGNRVNVRFNGSWGCHDEEIPQFIKWFQLKSNEARDKDEARQNATTGVVGNFLK
jgi:hypothetical protein